MQGKRSAQIFDASKIGTPRSIARVTVALLSIGAAACGDSSGPGVGGLSTLVVQPTSGLTALAGTTISTPIVITPQDASGHVVPNEHATFTVTAGGGTIANTTGQTNPDGSITAPAWTLGKSAVPQTLQVTVGDKTTTIDATVQTAYRIEIRFFGRTLPQTQQALFTTASARLLGAIVGSVPDVNLDGADPAACGVTGQAVLSGSFTGVLIYASIDSIDGRGQTLAQSGPCYIRTDDAGNSDYRTAVGVMQFDSADIGSLTASGGLQQVVTHEMMHVLGFGSFWRSDAKNLLVNEGTPTVAYIGAGGIAGCKSIGGNITCANSVPVEGTQGGDGTIDGHWRESTFGSELMTGFLNIGNNPFSAMSIQSMQDLGYGVNTAAADTYRLPAGSIRASANVLTGVGPSGSPVKWERPLGVRPRKLPTMGFPITPRG